MPDDVVLDVIKAILAAFAGALAVFAGIVKLLHNRSVVQHEQHLADLREQLKREQEDKEKEDKPPRSARAVARKNHRD